MLRLVDLAAAQDEVDRAELELTGEEMRRARRGTNAVHRRRVLLRAALRRLLAVHLGTAPAHVPLCTTTAGRPYVEGRPDLDVTCSASEGLGLVVVSQDHRVGVDVEFVQPWTEDVLAEGWLSAAEQRTLLALPAEVRATAATRAWTTKEAVLKARGCGLLERPSSVATSIGESGSTVDGWQIEDVPVPAGWVASLAVGRLQEEPA